MRCVHKFLLCGQKQVCSIKNNSFDMYCRTGIFIDIAFIPPYGFIVAAFFSATTDYSCWPSSRCCAGQGKHSTTSSKSNHADKCKMAHQLHGPFTKHDQCATAVDECFIGSGIGFVRPAEFGICDGFAWCIERAIRSGVIAVLLLRPAGKRSLLGIKCSTRNSQARVGVG